MKTGSMGRMFLMTIALGAAVIVPAQAQADSVKRKLSGYHFSAPVAELSAAAGGEDALISELLVLRRDETTPFVGVRAEKVLLKLAADSRAKSALVDDVRADRYAGLARTVALHIDSVTDAGVRRELASALLERASREAAFVPFARTLQSSSDGEVSSAARAALP